MEESSTAHSEQAQFWLVCLEQSTVERSSFILPVPYGETEGVVKTRCEPGQDYIHGYVYDESLDECWWVPFYLEQEFWNGHQYFMLFEEEEVAKRWLGENSALHWP